MDHFNISSYIKIMKKALNQSQIATSQFLFGVFEMNETLNLKFNSSNKVISGLVSQQTEIPADLQEASKNPDIIQKVREYFTKIIASKITSHLLNDACEALQNLLKTDATVSVKTASNFKKMEQEQGQAFFLAESFLYALSKPNRAEELLPSTDDFPLLDEVANECPICHTKLTKKVKGVVKKHYEIVPIFPNHLTQEKQLEFKSAQLPVPKLTSLDNKIALCPDHAENYLTDPEIDEYVQLSTLKTNYAKNYELKQELAQIDLEAEINTIISALTAFASNNSLENLNLTALAINQKILPDFPLLRNTIQSDVLTYYRFIRELCSEVETYDLIASEVKKAFRKLDQSDLTQPEIVEQLSQWLLHHAKLSQSSLLACRIVISFFIQSCEVFNEISK